MRTYTVSGKAAVDLEQREIEADSMQEAAKQYREMIRHGSISVLPFDEVNVDLVIEEPFL